MEQLNFWIRAVLIHLVQVINIANMKERIIRAVAGALVVMGVSLAYLVSPTWLVLPAFIGLNLFQSSFTKFCPLEYILDKMKIT